MESRDKPVGDVSRDARELPSNKLVMDPSPRAIRESGKFEFVVGRLLKEFPSDVSLVLVRREKSLKSFGPKTPRRLQRSSFRRMCWEKEFWCQDFQKSLEPLD